MADRINRCKYAARNQIKRFCQISFAAEREIPALFDHTKVGKGGTEKFVQSVLKNEGTQQREKPVIVQIGNVVQLSRDLEDQSTRRLEDRLRLLEQLKREGKLGAGLEIFGVETLPSAADADAEIRNIIAVLKARRVARSGAGTEGDVPGTTSTTRRGREPESAALDATDISIRAAPVVNQGDFPRWIGLIVDKLNRRGMRPGKRNNVHDSAPPGLVTRALSVDKSPPCLAGCTNQRFGRGWAR
ncbi:MAG: hypothetical protein IH969_01005 [Candidatus Krumholzibacteriota bacterium]|nr:hypothetical protein [Candidatus Krumholzibacteriota bacterium]